MKIIRFNTPFGQYEIPLKLVAQNRADYFACKIDGHEKGSAEWQDEVDWVMEDSFEGIDWLINNTDFEDWDGVATKINSDFKVSSDDFWRSSDDFEILNKT